MRLLRPLLPWLTLSAPMLLMLGVVMLACGSENAVFSFFRQHRLDHPTLKAALKLVTDWTNLAFYAWFLWSLVKSLRTGDKRTTRFILIYIATQVAIALIAVRLLKVSIGRPRPGEDPFPQAFTTKPSYHSMPSGHTTEATTSAMSLVGQSRRFIVPVTLGLVIALLGFSRIYLGWHHPSDVLCGWMLGSVAGLAVTLLTPKSSGHDTPCNGEHL